MRSVFVAGLFLVVPAVNAAGPAPQLLHLERTLTAKQDARDRGELPAEKYQEFIEAFRTELDAVMTRVPAIPENKGLHARILSRMGPPEQAAALEVLDAALSQAPESPPLLIAKGGILHERGDFSAANSLARRAWESSGRKDQSAWALLKLTEGRAGAVVGLAPARLPPASDFAHLEWSIPERHDINERALEHIRRATKARERSDFAEMRAQTQAAMNADPTSKTVQRYYGLVKDELARHAEVKGYLDRSVEAYKAGRADESLEWAQKAYDRHPNDMAYEVLEKSRRNAAEARKRTGDPGKSGGSLSGILSMTRDWIAGAGAAHRNFGQDTPFVEDMKTAPMVEKAKRVFYEKNSGRSRGDYRPLTNYKGEFGLMGLRRAGLNPTQQFVGSYRIDIIPKDDGNLFIVIQNTTSMKSFLYGLGPSWSRETFAPFGNMSQTYQWSEPMR